jgi:hypothetical protein
MRTRFIAQWYSPCLVWSRLGFDPQNSKVKQSKEMIPHEALES